MLYCWWWRRMWYRRCSSMFCRSYSHVSEKTKKRKAAEGQLQIKRQEMDKAKASSFVSFCFSKSYNLQGCERHQMLVCIAKLSFSNTLSISRYSCPISTWVSILICSSRELVIQNTPLSWTPNPNPKEEVRKSWCMPYVDQLYTSITFGRINGGTAHEDRIAAIDEYNKPGSEKISSCWRPVLVVWASILLLLTLSFCTTVIGMHLIE